MKVLEEDIIREIINVMRYENVDWEIAYYALAYDILTKFYVENDYDKRIDNIRKKIETRIKEKCYYENQEV